MTSELYSPRMSQTAQNVALDPECRKIDPECRTWPRMSQNRPRMSHHGADPECRTKIKESAHNVANFQNSQIVGRTIWNRLKLSEIAWNSLKSAETLWKRLKLPETLWEALKSTETLWNRLKRSEIDWNASKTSRNELILHKSHWKPLISNAHFIMRNFLQEITPGFPKILTKKIQTDKIFKSTKLDKKILFLFSCWL